MAGALGLAALAALLATAIPGGAAATSPLASPAASAKASARPPERPPIEVWLDRELPAAPAAGSMLDVGATVWDTLGREIPRMGATIFLRAVPRGGETPTETVAISDWHGHYRGSVAVPATGLDRIELGVSGTICENDVCRPDDWVFPLGGFGPPPDAPVTSLAEARIAPGDSSIRSGKPSNLSVTIQPNTAWPTWPRPSQVVVRAREARGPNVATATLPLFDAAAGTYEGSITIPGAGDFVLEAATDEDGGDATRFGTSMTRVTVATADGAPAGSSESSSGNSLDAHSDDGIPTVVVILLALAAVLGIGVIVAGFRSGGD
jgi:hypothetical protein